MLEYRLRIGRNDDSRNLRTWMFQEIGFAARLVAYPVSLAYREIFNDIEPRGMLG